LLLFYSALTCNAENYRYVGVGSIVKESDKLIVKHNYEWTHDTYNKWFLKISQTQDPFIEENDFAYISCFDKETGKLIFKKPSPALTSIYISDDSNYIIGLSKIKIMNPFQLVILDRLGNLIDFKHIAATEARLTLEEYEEFTDKYPDAHKFLEKLGRIAHLGNDVFVSHHGMGMPNNLGSDAWTFLNDRNALSHYSNNFGESVTNMTYWYYPPDGQLKLIMKNQKLVAISLLDLEGERFEINISQPKLKQSIPDIKGSEKVKQFNEKTIIMILSIALLIFLFLFLICIYFKSKRKK
jgi:hypothetical protein